MYLGSQLLAVQEPAARGSGVFWMHEDPVTKSKRVTNSAGTVVSTIETDPWGADTNRSSNAAFQPKKFTSYDRDGNGSDEAMFRRYNRKHSRFDQPDPYDGSYDAANPQSFNRYAYVQNDPVNFIDPSGLCPEGTTPATDPETGETVCVPNYDESVTVTGSWDDMSGYLPDWTSNNNLFFLITLLPSPQNPAVDVSKVETLLENPGCEKFLNAVLGELDNVGFFEIGAETFREYFQGLDSAGVFHNAKLPRGTLGRSVNLSMIQVDVQQAKPGNIRAVEYTAIHEVLHGGSALYAKTHLTMATAAYKVGMAQGLFKGLTGIAPVPGAGRRADLRNSARFDKMLFAACPPGK